MNHFLNRRTSLMRPLLRLAWCSLAMLGLFSGCDQRIDLEVGSTQIDKLNPPGAGDVVQTEAPKTATEPVLAKQEATPATPAIELAQNDVKPVVVADPETFEKTIRPFFQAHCVGCHGPDLAEAKLRLDTLPADFLGRPAADHWAEVLDRLNQGEMPPQDEPRPDPEELAAVIDWTTAEIQRVRVQAQSTGGRVLLRRLTRLEYTNTVRDLFRVEFVEGAGPLEQLPPDGAIGGFDRVSKSLLLDPSLMEAYLTVARSVVDQAVVFRPPLIPQRTLRFEFEQTPYTAMSYIPERRSAEVDGEFLTLMESAARTFAKLRHPYNDKEIPITGRYRVRVQAAATNPGDEPIYMDVTFGSEGRQARFRVDAPKNEPAVYEFEKTFDSFTPGEFQVGIVNGTRFGQGNAEWYHVNNQLTKLAEAGEAFEATRLKSRMRAEGAYDSFVRGSLLPEVLHLENLPKLHLDWIEVVGPLQGEFPPPSMAQIFGNEETVLRIADASTGPEQVLDDARAIFARMLPQAFRRPAKEAEIDSLVDLVGAELNAGASPEEAIKTGLVAMLCTPDFLLLFEPSQAPAARQLNNYELAARLSYFLWSSMPDAELTELAANGRLHTPEVLQSQVDRMLADPRREGFVNGFARQWLKIDEFDRFPPDTQIFPDFYATDMVGIEKDVKEEALAFFREVLKQNEPITCFLDSDWLILNERLAKLYGIDGVTGPELRRVSLHRGNEQNNEQNNQRRGGLLGMAGVHLWGADGSRTKPVERGKYILTVLFNDPPPPPPPNAGEVEPNLRGEVLTVRERLARHREQTTCNNCHRRIDPYGLAMENFNAIGQWRERLDGEKPLARWGENRPEIDATGTLPNGRDYSNFAEFKQELIAQQDRFYRGLAEKMFTYALGRIVEPADRLAIDQVVTAVREQDPSLRTMLKQLVISKPFQTK